jgi:hypothetical protein
MRIIAFITEPRVIGAILRHLAKKGVDARSRPSALDALLHEPGETLPGRPPCRALSVFMVRFVVSRAPDSRGSPQATPKWP